MYVEHEYLPVLTGSFSFRSPCSRGLPDGGEFLVANLGEGEARLPSAFSQVSFMFKSHLFLRKRIVQVK